MAPEYQAAHTGSPASINDIHPPHEARKKRRIRTETQLARKREIDRRSQHQVRHMNKERVNRLEQTVVELQGKLEKATSAIEYMQSYMLNIQSTESRAPLSELRYQGLGKGEEWRNTLPSSSRVQSRHFLDAHRDYFTDHYTTSESHNALDRRPSMSSLYHASLGSPHNSHYHALISTPSPSDSISSNLLDPASPSIENTIKASRAFETCSFNILSRAHIELLEDPCSKQCIPRNPSLANLLLIDIKTNPVVEAISCSFKDCSPLEIADTMATYFIMYRLLRWRIHPDPESYEDVPIWYRPLPIQETMPHNLSYDFWAWPQLRKALLSGKYNYSETKFNMDMCSNITIEWPKEKPLVIKSRCDDQPIVNPEFEAHVMEFENWKVRKGWADIYPELVGFVNIADNSE